MKRTVVLSLCLLASAVAPSACGYDELTRGGHERLTPETCGGCHVEVFAEWSASAHARAFAGDSYRAITADHQFEGCVGCHAPDSIFGRLGGAADGSTAPAARDVRRAHGVDCVACHLHDGVLVGPLSPGGLVEPHPIRRDEPLYTRSELCGRCHVGTFAQWSAAPATEPDGRDKRTCQQCHMPAVERTVTQATNAVSKVIVALEHERPQRRHQFDLLAVRGFEGIADLELTAGDDGTLRLALRNRLPHALPTGDFGPRVLHAFVTQHDAAGAVVARDTLTWSARLGTAVGPFARDTRSVPRHAGAASARVVLTRPAGPTSEAFDLATATWSAP